MTASYWKGSHYFDCFCYWFPNLFTLMCLIKGYALLLISEKNSTLEPLIRFCLFIDFRRESREWVKIIWSIILCFKPNSKEEEIQVEINAFSSSVYISFPKERGNGSCLDDSVMLCIILLQCLLILFAFLTFKLCTFFIKYAFSFSLVFLLLYWRWKSYELIMRTIYNFW